jgi:hypothetical protein
MAPRIIVPALIVLNPEAQNGQFVPVNAGFDVLITESRLYNSDLFRRWAPCLAR